MARTAGRQPASKKEPTVAEARAILQQQEQANARACQSELNAVLNKYGFALRVTGLQISAQGMVSGLIGLAKVREVNNEPNSGASDTGNGEPSNEG